MPPQLAGRFLPERLVNHWPIRVPRKRAFVYVHGKRLDPLSGTSDLEIAYWCYKTKQKLMFLWFQFLEGVSLPRTIVKANDITVAQQVAGQVSRLKSSGVLPVAPFSALTATHTSVAVPMKIATRAAVHPSPVRSMDSLPES